MQEPAEWLSAVDSDGNLRIVSLNLPDRIDQHFLILALTESLDRALDSIEKLPLPYEYGGSTGGYQKPEEGFGARAGLDWWSLIHTIERLTGLLSNTCNAGFVFWEVKYERAWEVALARSKAYLEKVSALRAQEDKRRMQERASK